MHVLIAGHYFMLKTQILQGLIFTVFFSRQTKSLRFDYRLCESCFVHDCIKDLGALLDIQTSFAPSCGLHIFSDSSVVGLIRTEICSSLQTFLILCCAVVRLKLEQAAAVWNVISSPVASNFQCIQ